MLKYIIIAIMALTILGFAQTPGDIVRQSKIVQPQVLDLSNTDPSVFNTTAFANELEGTGRLNASLPAIPQNEVGILDSSLAFLNTPMDLQQPTNVILANPRMNEINSATVPNNL